MFSDMAVLGVSVLLLGGTIVYVTWSRSWREVTKAFAYSHVKGKAEYGGL